MIALEIVFWLCVALIAYTHLGYPALLYALVALRRTSQAGVGMADAGARPDPSVVPSGRAGAEHMPPVSLVVAAYDEEDVIAAKVADALALDYPRERLEVIVASDGSGDATVERARAAGADLVLDLPRGGKVTAQNAAAERASGEIVAFSDANCRWAPDALRRLVEPFADPAVGYVCGQVRFADAGGGNLEGAYWRYEMAVREMESSLAGVTAGNGGIYAVRRDAYIPLPPSGSHDLSFPFALARRGMRSLYAPDARAEEKMVPTMEGEFARKRRMMVGLWDIVVGEGMLSPARLSAPLRLRARLPPAAALPDPVPSPGRLRRQHRPARPRLGLRRDALPPGRLPRRALLGRVLPLAPLRFARYYAMTTASIAAGLWDRARRGAPGTWEKAEGTR